MPENLFLQQAASTPNGNLKALDIPKIRWNETLLASLLPAIKRELAHPENLCGDSKVLSSWLRPMSLGLERITVVLIILTVIVLLYLLTIIKILLTMMVIITSGPMQ